MPSLAPGPARAEERDRHDRNDDEQRADAECQDVGEDEIEPEQDDAELEHRAGGDLEAGRGSTGNVCEVRERHAEHNAEHERRQARERAMGCERYRDPDPREGEAGRCAGHSPGCRNG